MNTQPASIVEPDGKKRTASSPKDHSETQRTMEPEGGAARVRSADAGAVSRRSQRDSFVRSLTLFVALVIVASACGSSEAAGPSTTSNGAAGTEPNESASDSATPTTDPETTPSETTTLPVETTALTSIHLRDPTPDQILQWLGAMLPIQLGDVIPDIVPETCNTDDWISGVAVLPSAFGNGDFDVACTVNSATPIFVSVSDGNTCFPDAEWPEETWVDECSDFANWFFGGAQSEAVNPHSELIFTINGDPFDIPDLSATRFDLSGDDGGQPFDYRVVFVGYLALLDLPAGQYTIVTGHQSLQDDGIEGTITIELTVEN